MSADTQAQIEAQIARTRQELRLTVDELSERLDPRVQATQVVDEVKLAVADLKRRVTGEERPYGEPEPGRSGWIALGSAAAVVLAIGIKLVRR